MAILSLAWLGDAPSKSRLEVRGLRRSRLPLQDCMPQKNLCSVHLVSITNRKLDVKILDRKVLARPPSGYSRMLLDQGDGPVTAPPLGHSAESHPYRSNTGTRQSATS